MSPGKLGVSLGVIAIVALAALVLWPTSPPVSALPKPNGYDDFLEAARIVSRASDPLQAKAEELQRIIQQNTNALALVRRGLGKQCLAPVEFTEAFITNKLSEITALKALALAFVGEGRFAESEGRTNDALRSYLDCIRFGQEMTRGGLIIHKLVGLAIQSIGLQRLRAIQPVLNAAQLREEVDALDLLERKQESPEQFLERDQTWSRYAYTGLRRLRARIEQWQMGFSRKNINASFILRVRHFEAELRLFQVEAALRLHQMQSGVYPQTLSQLVPQYLHAVPIDPFSEKPLVYRPQTNSFLLYSVGPDGKDDGGKPLPRGSNTQGDLISTPR